MFRDDVDTFDDNFLFFWERFENFCLNWCTLFSAIFICLNAETVFPGDDSYDVSSVDFHSDKY